MPGLIGNLPGAVGDAAKNIGKSIVSEAKRVPQDIVKDVVEGVSGGAIDIDAGKKMEAEMTPEEKRQKEIKKRQEAAQIQKIHSELEAIVRQKQQQEAQRRQQIEQQDEQKKKIEENKKESLKQRIVAMFTKRASSKGEMEKGKK